jgi:hypothetical protein
MSFQRMSRGERMRHSTSESDEAQNWHQYPVVAFLVLHFVVVSALSFKFQQTGAMAPSRDIDLHLLVGQW